MWWNYGNSWDFEGGFEADLEGGSGIPLGRGCCAQRLGDKLVVGVPSPGSIEASQHRGFLNLHKFSGGVFSQARHREENTRTKRKRRHKSWCQSSARVSTQHLPLMCPCVCASHTCFQLFTATFPLHSLLSRPFPSPPLSDLCNLKSCLGADIMTRPDFKINLPLDTGLFYWVHQG